MNSVIEVQVESPVVSKESLERKCQAAACLVTPTKSHRYIKRICAPLRCVYAVCVCVLCDCAVIIWYICWSICFCSRTFLKLKCTARYDECLDTNVHYDESFVFLHPVWTLQSTRIMAPTITCPSIWISRWRRRTDSWGRRGPKPSFLMCLTRSRAENHWPWCVHSRVWVYEHFMNIWVCT